MIVLSKCALAGLLAGIVVAQAWIVPDVAGGFAQLAPEFAGLRLPGVVLVDLLLLFVQGALLCLWRLLSLAGERRLFEDGSFRWVDTMIAFVGASMLTVIVGGGVIGGAGAGSPFVLFLVVIALAVGTAAALLLAALRDVLRDAVHLQDQVAAPAPAAA